MIDARLAVAKWLRTAPESPESAEALGALDAAISNGKTALCKAWAGPGGGWLSSRDRALDAWVDAVMSSTPEVAHPQRYRRVQVNADFGSRAAAVLFARRVSAMASALQVRMIDWDWNEVEWASGRRDQGDET